MSISSFIYIPDSVNGVLQITETCQKSARLCTSVSILTLTYKYQIQNRNFCVSKIKYKNCSSYFLVLNFLNIFLSSFLCWASNYSYITAKLPALITCYIFCNMSVKKNLLKLCTFLKTKALIPISNTTHINLCKGTHASLQTHTSHLARVFEIPYSLPDCGHPSSDKIYVFFCMTIRCSFLWIFIQWKLLDTTSNTHTIVKMNDSPLTFKDFGI